MKYWKSHNRPKHNSIIPIAESRLISLTKTPTDTIYMEEMCDEWFGMEFSKEAAVEFLEEAIAWIKEDSS